MNHFSIALIAFVSCCLFADLCGAAEENWRAQRIKIQREVKEQVDIEIAVIKRRQDEVLREVLPPAEEEAKRLVKRVEIQKELVRQMTLPEDAFPWLEPLEVPAMSAFQYVDLLVNSLKKEMSKIDGMNLTEEGIKTQLANEYRMWKIGENLSFADFRGRKIRGRLNRVTRGGLVVGTQFVNIQDLGDNARARVDKDFHDKMVKKQLDERLMRLQNEKDTWLSSKMKNQVPEMLLGKGFVPRQIPRELLPEEAYSTPKASLTSQDPDLWVAFQEVVEKIYQRSLDVKLTHLVMLAFQEQDMKYHPDFEAYENEYYQESLAKVMEQAGFLFVEQNELTYVQNSTNEYDLFGYLPTSLVYQLRAKERVLRLEETLKIMRNKQEDPTGYCNLWFELYDSDTESNWLNSSSEPMSELGASIAGTSTVNCGKFPSGGLIGVFREKSPCYRMLEEVLNNNSRIQDAQDSASRAMKEFREANSARYKDENRMWAALQWASAAREREAFFRKIRDIIFRGLVRKMKETGKVATVEYAINALPKGHYVCILLSGQPSQIYYDDFSVSGGTKVDITSLDRLDIP